MHVGRERLGGRGRGRNVGVRARVETIYEEEGSRKDFSLSFVTGLQAP